MKHADEKSFKAVQRILKKTSHNKVEADTGISRMTLIKISDDNTHHTEVRLSKNCGAL